MALPLATLIAQRDACATILATPISSMTIDGTRVDYAAYEDARKRIGWLDQEIAKAQAAPPKGYSYAQFSKDGRGNR
jgi:hypothetical protein